jgi:cytochrome c biogenesis protein CcmG/thiol:disulfide interchange protein DsbE
MQTCNHMRIKVSRSAAPAVSDPRRALVFGLPFAAAALSAMAVPAAMAMQVGQEAPDFEVPSSDGGQLRLSDHRGRVVYLDFWASWCGPCRQSFPWMEQMHQRYAGQGLRILAIALDQKEADARTFLGRHRVTFTVGFDTQGRTPRVYSVRAMPSSVLIGRDGRILATHQGFRAEDKGPLEKLVKSALEVSS